MKHISIIFLIFAILGGSISAQKTAVIKGLILDSKSKEPMPYANIIILNKGYGSICNEKGIFSLDVSDMDQTDTLRIQFVGYEPLKLILTQVDSMGTYYLEEKIINLAQAFVYGNPPSPKKIIKRFIENKNDNYKARNYKMQCFIRFRNLSDINEIIPDFKKSNIEEIDGQILSKAASLVPRHQTSYTDFFGDIYKIASNKDTLKINPIRTVRLKHEEISELQNIGKIFDKLFENTSEDEYWKVKSGVLGQKLTIENNQEQDSIDNDKHNTEQFSRNFNFHLKYTSIEDIKEWEFLYETEKYTYELLGGTRVNGEDVFIIEFEPKRRGDFQGRIYISTETYALIRADYNYGQDKYGKNFNLFGLSYQESEYTASILFEKSQDIYRMKYFSKNTAVNMSFDRNISLIKKRKRFLIDKKLKELKLKLNFQVSNETLIEFLVLNDEKINLKDWEGFSQEKYMDIIHTDHFSDELWKGYPVIEPTQRMRDYKKQSLDE